MREHAPLGGAGGAGGVDERVGVLGAQCGAAALELLRPLAGRNGDTRRRRVSPGFGSPRVPALAHLRERDRLGGVVGVDHDHRAQLRQLLAHRGDLRELLSVLAHDRARARVGDHPVALLGGVGRVDRHNDSPGGGDRHVHVGPLWAGAREDAHPLPRLDAEVDKAERDLLHDLPELGVGDVLPGAGLLVSHRDLVRKRSSGGGDQVGDGARGRGLRGGRPRDLCRGRAGGLLCGTCLHDSVLLRWGWRTFHQERIWLRRGN